MNIDIRKNIIENFKDVDKEEIIKSIEESLNDNEEITLPGLGVFFEILWKNADDNIKNNIIALLEEHLKRNQS